MRARWEALHAGLVRSVRTLEADQAFQEARRRHATLALFNDVGAVIAHLADLSGDRDAKDQILATLVAMAQAGEAPQLASSLLWLGLWPGLDAVFRRRLRHFVDYPGDLASELASAFSEVVAKLNLATVNRVAACLVRGTERTVLEGVRRVWADGQRFQPLEDSRHDEELFAPLDKPSELGLRGQRTVAEEVAALRTWLVPMVGEDADLLLAVVALDETQREAGERLGLTHAAARKRLQRGLQRVREHLASDLSHFDLETRV